MWQIGRLCSGHECCVGMHRPRFEGGLPRVPEGNGIDYRQDFFDKAAYLTVSGQLQVIVCNSNFKSKWSTV